LRQSREFLRLPYPPRSVEPISNREMKTTEGATQCPFSIEINLRKFFNWTDDAVNLATKRSEFGEQADSKIPGGA